MDLPTIDEIAQVFERQLRLELDPLGTGAVNLRPGSDNAALVSMAAQLGAKVFAYAADRAAARDINTATGDDLDDIARDRYGDARKPANAATGRVYLRRTGTRPTLIPKGSRVGVRAEGAQQAVTYEAGEDVSVPAGTSTASVPIVCTAQGVLGNVDLAAVKDILDTLPDTTWSLYVPTAGDALYPPEVLGGGADVESDDRLRTRLLQQSVDDNREKATARAILTGAMRVPGVLFATAIEPQDGTVILYTGDASFLLPTALRIAVLSMLGAYRAQGVPVLVLPYNVQVVQVTASIFMSRRLANYDVSAVKAAGVAAVQRYFEGRAQPDEYFTNAIVASLFRAHDEVQEVVLVSPTADVRRPQDSGYGLVTALNRFVVKPESISVSIFDPLTT